MEVANISSMRVEMTRFINPPRRTASGLRHSRNLSRRPEDDERGIRPPDDPGTNGELANKADAMTRLCRRTTADSSIAGDGYGRIAASLRPDCRRESAIALR